MLLFGTSCLRGVAATGASAIAVPQVLVFFRRAPAVPRGLLRRDARPRDGRVQRDVSAGDLVRRGLHDRYSDQERDVPAAAPKILFS